MADVRPFKGVLYNKEEVGDFSKVMAPPYDVISPAGQQELYDRHPNNVIRLILGKTSDDDAAGSDRYSRAAEALKDWMNSGVLARDEKPAVYYYTQTYTAGGGEYTRKGYIALARLEEFGKGSVHPHEKTLSGPKVDRLKLMNACGANLSCIFSVYSDPGLSVNRILDEKASTFEPLIDITDDDGIVDKVWRVDDPETIGRVASVMDDKALYIADGHHRYETALNYRNEMREKDPSHTGDEPYNFVMMYFSNMDDEGMTIWPTHRVIHGVDGLDTDDMMAKIGEYFEVEEFPFEAGTEEKVRSEFLARKEEVAGSGKTAFGLYIRGRSAYCLLTLKSQEIMDTVFGDSIPSVFKNLDVTVLHSLILERSLGISVEAQEKKANLVYVKSDEEAVKAGNDGDNQLVFFMNATKIEQVKAVAEAGQVMPQKSTYFYPKLLSGLVLNVHDNRETVASPARV